MSRRNPVSGAAEVFAAFLKLGLTSFGGPLAHLGYFHREFVIRRQWLSERAYTDLVALCQFLPGPSSSQVGISIGLLRRGYLGAIAAWAGFTLPSALALVALGLSIARYPTWISAGALHGLKVLSVAVVAQALWTMAFGLWHTRRLVAIGVAATLVAWILPGTYGQIAVILLAAVCGIGLVKPDTACAANAMELPINSAIGTRWLTALGVVFLFLFAMDTLGGPKLLTIFWAFFRTGALVFGGGHVVLPVLHAAVVAPGWVEDSVFTAGYGAAQAVPGPLFTFAAFLGAVIVAPLGGWLCAILCLLAIFAPSFFLVFGTLPHWVRLRQNRRAQSALMAVNAATVGILAAAFQHYVWRSAVNSIADLALTCIALLAITVARLPVWAVASTCALLGIALQHFA